MTNLWDIYTAKQEYSAFFKDKYQRFPFVLNTFNPLEPCVSNYLYSKGFKPEYPEGKQMAVCISHDIDTLFLPKKSLPSLAKAQLKAIAKLDLKQVATNFKPRKIYPDWKLENITAIHENYNIKSTYYFLSLSDGEEDFNYSISEISGIINELFKKGNSIGLHGGHTAYNNIDKIKSEKNNIEKSIGISINGYRNHYLHFETPTTWELLAKAGFKYDTTFGHAQSVGFRNGMCYPFQPYNLNTQAYIDIYELPLMVMDATLFDKYMCLNYDNAKKLCTHLIDTICNVNGVYSMLWHNNMMQGNNKKFYQELIEYLTTKKAWFTTGGELIEWWQQQGYFEQIKNLLADDRIKARVI